MQSRTHLWIILCLGLSLSAGCSVRETHTARTSTEQLLLSQAAERAVIKFEEAFPLLENKRVFVDGQYLDGVDRDYVFSSVRHYLNQGGALLVAREPQDYPTADGKTEKLGPEFVVELRRGTLGLKEHSFGFGVPLIPVPVPTTNLTTFFKPLYFLNRKKTEGWAKFQAWIYTPDDEQYVLQTDDLWGHTYYSQWWFLLVGPFDFSNDIYPDEDLMQDDVKVTRSKTKPFRVSYLPVEGQERAQKEQDAKDAQSE